MLSAKSQMSEQKAGLDSGAQDYICKPFTPKDLVAQVHGVSRRVGTTEKGAGPTMAARILVVDDEPSIVKLVKTTLEGRGYTVDEAFDGVEALAQAKLHQPDLILLDIMMPRMDGTEVRKRLLADPETKDIPVIHLSAVGDFDKQRQALDEGATDYIIKPFTPKRPRRHGCADMLDPKKREQMKKEHNQKSAQAAHHHRHHASLQGVARCYAVYGDTRCGMGGTGDGPTPNRTLTCRPPVPNKLRTYSQCGPRAAGALEVELARSRASAFGTCVLFGNEGRGQAAARTGVEAKIAHHPRRGHRRRAGAPVRRGDLRDLVASCLRLVP